MERTGRDRLVFTSGSVPSGRGLVPDDGRHVPPPITRQIFTDLGEVTLEEGAHFVPAMYVLLEIDDAGDGWACRRLASPQLTARVFSRYRGQMPD